MTIQYERIKYSYFAGCMKNVEDWHDDAVWMHEIQLFCWLYEECGRLPWWCSMNAWNTAILLAVWRIWKIAMMVQYERMKYTYFAGCTCMKNVEDCHDGPVWTHEMQLFCWLYEESGRLPMMIQYERMKYSYFVGCMKNVEDCHHGAVWTHEIQLFCWLYEECGRLPWWCSMNAWNTAILLVVHVWRMWKIAMMVWYERMKCSYFVGCMKNVEDCPWWCSMNAWNTAILLVVWRMWKIDMMMQYERMKYSYFVGCMKNVEDWHDDAVWTHEMQLFCWLYEECGRLPWWYSMNAWNTAILLVE